MIEARRDVREQMWVQRQLQSLEPTAKRVKRPANTYSAFAETAAP